MLDPDPVVELDVSEITSQCARRRLIKTAIKLYTRASAKRKAGVQMTVMQRSMAVPLAYIMLHWYTVCVLLYVPVSRSSTGGSLA